jgi:hypothetical protein
MLAARSSRSGRRRRFNPDDLVTARVVEHRRQPDAGAAQLERNILLRPGYVRGIEVAVAVAVSPGGFAGDIVPRERIGVGASIASTCLFAVGMR